MAKSGIAWGGGWINHLLMSMLRLNFEIVPETLVNEGGQSFEVHGSLTLKLYLRLWSVIGGSIIFQSPW